MKVYYCYACQRSFAGEEPRCFYCQGDFVEEASRAVGIQMLPSLLAQQNVHSASSRQPGTTVWSGSYGPTEFVVRSTVQRQTFPPRTTSQNNSESREEMLHNPLLMVMDFLQAHLPGDPAESVLRPLFQALGIPGDPRDYVTDPERYREILDQIFTQHQPSVQGLSAEDIDRCVVEVKEPTGECAICREDYAADAIVRKLPCGHVFHGDCVIPWLKRVASCPMCRKNPTASDTE